MTIKKRRETLTISMIIGACAAILLASFASFANKCDNIQGEVLRLHILARSDSEEDQNLKYRLRDYLINDMEKYFAEADTLEEAKLITAAKLSEIEENARRFIVGEGYGYDVGVSLENVYFTTRVYENITLPAGNYDALRVIIGEGEGKNWWCVLFPPLCLPACTDRNREPYFSKEASKLIENGGRKAEVRFAIYEWITGRGK